MALFSLLVAILVERLKLLPSTWQFDGLLRRYHASVFGSEPLSSDLVMALALVLPAVGVYLLSWAAAGLFWGGLSLVLWVLVSVLCLCHQQQRRAFKHYIQAACRGDVQACYHYAGELDCSECFDAVSETDLGTKVGQSVAWINYRYYGAVALYLVFLGPVGAIFYCTVRFYAEENRRKAQALPLVDTVLMLLDWLPSRLFAFGYVLSGEFSRALATWRANALRPGTSARRVITETAMAAESVAEDAGNAPVSVQPTLALLALTKRNFMLLVTLLSLLTIFGLVS
ncbi:beta-lactamase regulator AmpE [Shewanella salipaludis]|uniref:Beta-lactamase regulator AmpE n=1 Tax=Shewanella salipaludis TaxID=2723052 RepID=A0A972G174_9GAMM|nr:beta-lactamase regulator AmpE [Shewanella salipaludis]NMH66958.1 beta-lactamase regulator AmpE [Shewanella salipaludis]